MARSNFHQLWDAASQVPIRRGWEDMAIVSEEALLDVADIYFKAHKRAIDYLLSRQNVVQPSSIESDCSEQQIQQ